MSNCLLSYLPACLANLSLPELPSGLLAQLPDFLSARQDNSLPACLPDHLVAHCLPTQLHAFLATVAQRPACSAA